ncbi:hypothetical protein BDQ17DRAFT_1242178 [Cyathus striatus]|nr:hypothetical protein BDQ17DRAFT_1242178 [Cyathus striatus]
MKERTRQQNNRIKAGTSKTPEDRHRNIDPPLDDSSSDEEVIEKPIKNLKNKKVTFKDSEIQELPYLYVPPVQPAIDNRFINKTKEDFDIQPKGPIYKHQAPVEATVEINRIVDKMMSQDAVLSHEELLAISPAYRKAYKDRISSKRIMIGNPDNINDPKEKNSSQQDQNIKTVMLSSLEQPTAQVKTVDTEEGIKQVWFIGDPIMQYLETLPLSERDSAVFVARESENLRMVTCMVNGIKEEEALLDSGSQIISMSKETADTCRISYNPDITVPMQSANGQVQKTCGLAQNVPFRFGTLTIYMQVHVVFDPPYKILMGRPFDCLTESEVKNYIDGAQSVTIKDPNTGERCVIPTYARGEQPTIMKRNERQNFQFNSRI